MKTFTLIRRNRISCRIWLPSLLVAMFLQNVNAQCSFQVMHTGGTQTVGCTDVTVTSTGSAGNIGIVCNTGPYLIGSTSNGSYTFAFNPPVSGAVINVYAVNNFPSIGIEEMVVNVDGNFFPITIPGQTASCLSDAVIFPPGVIRGCDECASSWDSIRIDTPISTLTVEDNYVSGTPFGIVFSLLLCCPLCPTDAGVLSGSPAIICANGVANFAPTQQSTLDNNDVLQYILFSNPNDTLGSIVATSNTPSFGFNPATMLTGITYYAAAIAGNNAGGNVDLNDDCLDVSNALEFTWQPSPAVQFTISDPNVCDGACSTVNVVLTGTPPFQLTVANPFNGNATYTFGTNTGTFQICPPSGTPPGNVQTTAISLSDAFCTCE